MDTPGYEAAFPDLVTLAAHVAARIIGPGDAEDIAVATLGRAYERWDRIHAYAPSWVARTASNLAIDQLRRRQPPLHLIPTAPAADIAGTVVDSAQVVELLGRITSRQRRVIVLTVMCGYTPTEVGEILGLAPTTVSTHLNRALAALRRATPVHEGATTP